MKYATLIYCMYLAHLGFLGAQEPTRASDSIKEGFNKFMAEEGNAFFASRKLYYTFEKLEDDTLALKKKIELLSDEDLKKALNFPSSFFEIPEKIEGLSTLFNLYRETYVTMGTYVQDKEALISRYPFKNADDSNKVIAVVNSMNRILLKIAMEAKILKMTAEGEMHSAALPINRKFKALYSFIQDICKANNLAMPAVYIGEYQHTGTSLRIFRPVILLSPSLFKDYDEDIIRAIIAHELGHYYYGDSDKCKKFASTLDSNEALKRNYGHFKEYRADLFAAQYGYGFGGSQYFNKQPGAQKTDSNPGFSLHPSRLYRINYLKDLPQEPLLKTVGDKTYRLSYEPYFQKKSPAKYSFFNFLSPKDPNAGSLYLKLEPKLVELTDTTRPGKIINSTAQPLPKTTTARAARAAAQVLQAAKKVPK